MMLPPVTPEEMSEPGWETRRHAAWYARRAEWVRAMERAGFRVKVTRLGRGKRPPPGELDIADAEIG